MAIPKRKKNTLVAILKEAARIERVYFQPIASELERMAIESGIPPRTAKQIAKAELEGIDKKHSDYNISAILDNLSNESDEELKERVHTRQHFLVRAIILLFLWNTALVASMLAVFQVCYHLTDRLWASGCITAIMLFSSTSVSRVLVEKIIRGSINPRPVKQLKPQIKKEVAGGPPIGLTRDSSRRVAARRFRRYTIRGFIVYLILVLIARVFFNDFNLALVSPAPILITAVTYVEVQPLRNWYDGFLWNILHFPLTEYDMDRQLP